jgi:hypothetical protein
MSPEERQQFEARRAARAQNGGQGQGQGPGFGGRGGQQQPAARDNSRGITASITPGPTHQSGATTIDALFGPLPVMESRGRAWLYVDNKLKPVALRLGVTDGTFTEIISGDIQQGQEVVTNMVTGLEPKTTGGQQGGAAQNPLMGPQRGRGPGGGGRGR